MPRTLDCALPQPPPPFLVNDTATTELYTLSLHTLFRSRRGATLTRFLRGARSTPRQSICGWTSWIWMRAGGSAADRLRDRKSTRLNSSHVAISYAVFCLKKKKTHEHKRHVAQAGMLSRL